MELESSLNLRNVKTSNEIISNNYELWNNNKSNIRIQLRFGKTNIVPSTRSMISLKS